MTTQPFWLVWCPESGAPTRKQPSLRVAEDEAKRLARQNPGKQFFVCAPVMKVEKIEVGVTRFTIDPDKHSRDCDCDDCSVPF